MFLERLCNASGPVSHEDEVRKLIIDEVKDYVDEIKVDRMGNVIVHKKGKGKKVMLDAHMDEVAFLITAINDDGTMKFEPMGGINSKVIPSKILYIGKNRIPGVIGLKPIHLQSGDERRNSIDYDKCCLDIGTSSREETKKYVRLGDYAVFATEYAEFGEGLVKAKALDDRAGCAVLVEVLKGNYDCDLYGAFNVMEEIGDRGAYVSAYQIQPDIGIAIEGTICADMPGIPGHLRATEIGKGPAISIMDRTSIFNVEVTNRIISTAEDNGIPYQRRRAIAGGNDAGAIHTSGNGAKVATVSVPCRYIHSSVSVASLADFNNTVKLLKNYLLSL